MATVNEPDDGDAEIDVGAYLSRTDAPSERSNVVLDARELPPPQPLQKTLEALADLGDAVFVQLNDRRPQHLYPQLDDRGYRYETFDDDPVVTVIWSADAD